MIYKNTEFSLLSLRELKTNNAELITATFYLDDVRCDDFPVDFHKTKTHEMK